jgi:hypothetical protein
MYDAMVAFTDLIVQYHSMGIEPSTAGRPG